MEGEIHTLHLLMQTQEELQLDLKANNTKRHQKIKLGGSLTNKNLKKIHSSRLVGGAQTQRWAERCGDRCGMERQRRQQKRQSHTPVWWIKIGRATLGANNPSPRTDCTAQGSSARKINCHNFWL